MQSSPLRAGGRSICALAFSLLCVLTPMLAPTAHAQTGGALGGMVLDPDGKVVVDAVVLIRGEATGELRTTTTGNEGRFGANDLAPGSYAIEVAIPGFDLVQRTGVSVTAGERAEVTIQ